MAWQAIAAQAIVKAAWIAGSALWNRFFPEKLPKPRPKELEFPQSMVGTPIPMVWGTVRIDNPVLVDFLLYEQREYLTPIPPSYRTHGVMLFVLGTRAGALPFVGAAPQLLRIWYGDKEHKFSVPIQHGNFKTAIIDQGGKGAGGKFIADIEFFDGRSDQLITSHPAAATLKIDRAYELALRDRSLVPGYRHQMMMAVTAHPDVNLSSEHAFGETNQVFPIAVEVMSQGHEGSDINTRDANPAWAIYDLIVDDVWKLGYDADKVDIASFEAAAATLITEDHGCSILVYTEEQAAQTLAGLLDQIDGVLVRNESTGMHELRLIRSIADPESLDELNQDNTIGRPEIGIIGWGDSANRVEVGFTHRALQYKRDTAAAERLANAIGHDNRVRPLAVDYPACTEPSTAVKLAARELAVAARPLLTAMATASRAFASKAIGDALRVNWPDINITNKVVRIVDIDKGQLTDGAVRLLLVEDIFDVTIGGFTSPPDPPTLGEDLLPLTTRYIDEAPWWLTNQLYLQGGIVNPDEPKIMGLAARENDDALSYRGEAEPAAHPDTILTSILEPPLRSFPIAAKVAMAYAATLAPYDTTTGLVIGTVTGPNDDVDDPLAGDDWAAIAAEIQLEGKNLAIVGGEFIAFESITDNLDGTYTLNNVWRELLDTVSVDHAVGETVFLFVDVSAVGRRTWPAGYGELSVRLIPSVSGIESTSDYDHRLTTSTRSARPLRVAHLQLDSIEHAAGTAGTSGTGYKLVTVFEGGLDATWLQRELEALLIVRGDDDPVPAWAAEEGVTFEVWAQKMDGLDDEDEIEADRIDGVTGLGATAILVGEVGHGAIDVAVHAVSEDGLRSWQSPRVRVSAKTWRNLLANGTAGYATLAPWIETVATWARQQGTDSLEKSATGTWFQPLTDDTGTVEMEQTVDVTGYKPTGLTALVTWYTRQLALESDSMAIKIRALSAADVELATSTSSFVAGPTTHWNRREHELDLVVGTTQVEVTVLGFGAVGGGSTSGADDMGITHISLRVGQFSAELLANPSFDS